MKSYSKVVKNKINKHILGYFDKGAGWDSDDGLDNLKIQLKALDYMPTDYAKGLYMAEGGTFLIYYDDKRDFLNSLDINDSNKEFTDEHADIKYNNLIARQIQELVR